MPWPSFLPRPITGNPQFDAWADQLCTAIEQALNITGSPPIWVRRSAGGTSIGMARHPISVLARTGSGGIPKAVSGVPGKGDVTILSFDGTNAPVDTYADKAYNLDPNDGVAANTVVLLVRADRDWFVVVEPCAS